MRVFKGFEEVGSIVNPVVTTGTFDGVHFGHKVILERLKQLSRQNNGESVLITFHPHPRKVLYPDTVGKSLNLINTQREKIDLLREAGLDNLIIVEFTREFADISSSEFVEKYLVGKLGAKVIVVGFNHFFGHNKEGDFSFLSIMAKRFDFVTEMIPEQEVQNETVSSTEIRRSLSEGFIQRINAYLDHYYTVIADALPLPPVLSGNNVFQVVATDEEDKLLPPSGAYAVTVISGDSEIKGIALITVEAMENGIFYLSLFGDNGTLTSTRKPVRINFHRRMSDPLETSRLEDDPAFINSIVKEVEDLIY